MAASLAIGLRTAFVVLGCLAAATVIYTVATDGLPFRKELLTPWMAATLIDFYINILAIGVWIIYKESIWILSVIWIVLLVCFGSITTCAYIVLQFVKLTPQESLLDPIYFVLLRNKKREEVESKSILSVVSARFLFCILGCLMLATLTYTIVTDGSPFRQELLTPWMSATLVDFYVNVFAISVWVAYKERTWIRAALWIILLICFGRSKGGVTVETCQKWCRNCKMDGSKAVRKTYSSLSRYFQHNYMCLHCSTTLQHLASRPYLPHSLQYRQQGIKRL